MVIAKNVTSVLWRLFIQGQEKPWTTSDTNQITYCFTGHALTGWIAQSFDNLFIHLNMGLTTFTCDTSSGRCKPNFLKHWLLLGVSYWVVKWYIQLRLRVDERSFTRAVWLNLSVGLKVKLFNRTDVFGIERDLDERLDWIGIGVRCYMVLRVVMVVVGSVWGKCCDWKIQYGIQFQTLLWNFWPLYQRDPPALSKTIPCRHWQYLSLSHTTTSRPRLSVTFSFFFPFSSLSYLIKES